MALADNLVAYWKLDESSGNATDATGGGFTLTNTNTVGYSTGLINNGADFGTTQQHNKTLNTTSSLGVNLSGAASFSGWMKVTAEPSVTNDNYRFIDWRSTTGTSRYMIAGYTFSGSVTHFRVDPSGGAFTYNTTLGTSSWHHIVVTYAAGGTVTLYLDGSSVATGTRGTGTVGQSFNLGNGVETVTGQPCILDEVGIWSKELSSSEVTSLYNGGAGLAYPLTVASGPANLKSYNTNLKANIKSINTNLIANVKSLDTNV